MTPREEGLRERGLVRLAGGAGALGASLVTLPLLPPLSAVLAVAGLGLAVASRRAADSRRVRLSAAVVAALSGVLLVTSLGVSSAMSVSVSPARPSESIPATSIPVPDEAGG